jgi:hypothetical protein
MATYQKDRFDSVPDDLLRTGAHRGPQKNGRGWITFAWAALATGILVVAGLFGLALVNGKLADFSLFGGAATASPTPTVTTTPTAAPLLNATLPITILNGTLTTGLANTVGDNLVKQGWAGAAQGIGSRANAGTTDIKQTIVYYSDPANEGAARALVLSLKVGTIRLSAVYAQSPITVVVGSDYKPQP